MSELWMFLRGLGQKNMEIPAPVKVKKWGKLLAFWGFNYCSICGYKQKFSYKHGYGDVEVYKCPNGCTYKIMEDF